ncbi:MAG: hypothetical protein NTZ48_04370 [Candidatus Omnitrophica bacterium]|nr:hypothetical protein [Candidatus Omnitrophota bacterium]
MFVVAMSIIAGGLILSHAETSRDVKYLGGAYRDPFLSFIPQEKKEVKEEKITLPAFKLQGIVWGESKPRAIINGAVVSEGDVIEGAKATLINKEGIEFLYKGINFILERTGAIKIKTEKEE